jgi:hypothetical protein
VPITQADQRKLFQLSGNRCAFPGCPRSLVHPQKRNTRPALAVAATVLNVTWNIVLFVWLMPLPVVEQPGAAPIAGVANPYFGAACGLSVLGICAVLFGRPSGRKN